jgi:hypothetical protein
VTKGQTKDLKVALRAHGERRRARTWAWTLTGTTAAAGRVGAYFGIAESASYRHASNLYEQGRRGYFTATTRAQIASYRSDGDTQRTVAVATLGVALVALGGAVYFWIRERGDEHVAGEPPSLALTPTLLPGGGGFAFTRRLAWGDGGGAR